MGVVCELKVGRMRVSNWTTCHSYFFPDSIRRFEDMEKMLNEQGSAINLLRQEVRSLKMELGENRLELAQSRAEATAAIAAEATAAIEEIQTIKHKLNR